MGHRILLVREEDAQHSSSGCCGRLGGHGSELGAAADFGRNRCEMEAMGAVYRALRATFADREAVDVTVVDPRNSVWLVPAIWRDARRRGMPWRQAWRQVTKGVSYNAVVVDGRVVFAGTVPAPDEAVDVVLDELARAGADA